jgi:hypothetical protein
MIVVVVVSLLSQFCLKILKLKVSSNKNCCFFFKEKLEKKKRVLEKHNFMGQKMHFKDMKIFT